MCGSVQPTVVLVHGAFADASGFGGVIRELTTSGYEVVAPPNPLRSLAFDAKAVGDFVRAIHGPVVLVGHSYGGAGYYTDVGRPGQRGRVGVPGRIRHRRRGELRERTRAVPAVDTGLDVRADRVRRRGRAWWPRALHRQGSVPGDVLRGRSGRRRRGHVGNAATAVDRDADGGRDRSPVEDQAVVVPGVRTRQCHSVADRMDATTDSISGSHTAFIAQPVAVASFIKKALIG